MKRKPVVKGLFAGFIALLALQGLCVRAEEPSGEREQEEYVTKEKTVRLPAGEVTRIPRYEEEGSLLYVLDESSIRVYPTGTAQAEGADVMTATRILKDLPDNDLERIPKTLSDEDTDAELLYVIYTVTGRDGYGQPEEYEAACCYGWLEKYYLSSDSEWEAAMVYYGRPREQAFGAPEIEYLYEDTGLEGFSEDRVPGQGNTLPEEEAGNTGAKDGAKSMAKTEASPRAAELSLWRNIAALAAGGVLLVAAGYYYIPTASVAAALYSGDYERIGRVRITRRKGRYETALTEKLIERAETQRYRLKLPGYLRRRGEPLDITCPDGSRITRKPEQEIFFTLLEEE